MVLLKDVLMGVFTQRTSQIVITTNERQMGEKGKQLNSDDTSKKMY